MTGDLQHRITSFVRRHKIMALAATDGRQPYVATVFYVTFDGKVLYFKSRTGSNHSTIFRSRPCAAASIYNHESTYQRKQGVQLTGTVERVVETEEMGRVVQLYSTTFVGAGEKLKSLSSLLDPEAVSTMYKLICEKAKCVDSEEDIVTEVYEDWATP